MQMIRFQPRRVANIVAGLTLFWCGILSAFFWIKGHNFNFLFLMLLTVAAGFLMSSAKTNAYKNDILKKLGFQRSRNLPLTDRGAFASTSQGVYSSIGPIPFQYPPPARLNSSQLKKGEFSTLIEARLPSEIRSSEQFLTEFMESIAGGRHAKLHKAILEIYCHPDYVDLPAGITRHNGALLLTHCLRVAGLMFHRANEFSLKNYYVSANNPDYKISRDDDLLLVAGLTHDLGKVVSFNRNESGEIIGMKSKHHKASCRLVSSLPEFWSNDLSSEDRYIIQSCCIYSTEYESSPIQAFITDQSKPKAVLDRLQFLIELTAECDILASQIENGVKYEFDISPELLKIPEIKDDSDLLEDTKIDLFSKFSEFISTHAIVNGKGTDRSVGFKYLDTSDSKPKHLLFVDEIEFNSSFAAFLNKPAWGDRENKSHALAMAVLPKLDEGGYLVRSNDIGVQPAINCLYKVDFFNGEPAAITHSLRSCFVLDLTKWPNQNKLRDMASCRSRPVIVNSIFGNKFIAARRSVMDSDVYEMLGVQDTTRSVTSNIESLVTSRQAQKDKKKQSNAHLTIGCIKSGLAKKQIVPAMVSEEGVPIPIANADTFFKQLGVKMMACDPGNQELKELGIVSIRNSKKIPGTHIVLLDPNVYSTKTSM